MAIIRRQRRISNVGISAVGVATRIGGSSVPVNVAPVYIGGTTITLTEGLGGSFDLDDRFFDENGDALTYASVNPTTGVAASLPAGITLVGSVVTISTSLAIGNYSIRFSASDGIAPAVLSPVITIAVASSDFAITPEYFISPYTTRPDGGVLYVNAQVDKRGGLILWCDGDHVYLNSNSNSVRYYNRAGSVAFHGIAINEDGYLIPPGAPSAQNPVAEEDNYPFWYVPRIDKFFWIFGRKTNSSGTGTGQFGIFDMAATPPRWEYGNAGANAAQWPSGPYWTDYVRTGGVNQDSTMSKNSPSGWSEMLDTGVAVSLGGDNTISTSSQERLFVIEPNLTGLETSKPYRAYAPLVRHFPYHVNVQDTGHNQFILSGVVVGEWLYYIRPAIASEKASYDDVVVGGITYPGEGSREFWRIRMRFPFNEYQKLAQFPEFDIAYQSVNAVAGPSLHYDSDSNSIICLYEKLWLYDIDSDGWANRTPPNYQRVFNGIGGFIKANREIIFAGGPSPDFPGGNNPATGLPWFEHFHRVQLTGGIKPRARWIKARLDKLYPGKSNTDIPLGKHRRFKYFPIHRRHDGTLMYGDAPRTTQISAGGDLLNQLPSNGGYVWSFGGDYDGIPGGSSSPPNYPPLAPGATWANQSGRQDQYRAHVKEVGGEQVVELACNHVAYYPYPGGPDPASTQAGPRHPDGCGLACDRDGYIWVGPGYYRFEIATNPSSAGSVEMPVMYRFQLPNLHTDGIRMGNGWTRPAQTWPATPNFGQSNWWSDYDPKNNEIVFATHGTDPWKFWVWRFPCTPTNGVHAATRALATQSTDTAARQKWEKFCNENVVKSQKYDFTVQGGNTILQTSHPFQDGDRIAFVDGATGPGLTLGHNFVVRNSVPGVSYQLSAYGSTSIIDTLTAPTGACKVRRGVNPTSGGVWTASQAVVGDYLYAVILTGATSYRDINAAYIVKINLRNVAGNYSDYEFIAFPSDFFWARAFDEPTIIGFSLDSVGEARDMQAMGHYLVLGPAGVEHYETDPWCWWYDTNRAQWTKGQTYSQMRAAAPELPYRSTTQYEINGVNTNFTFNLPHVARGMMCTVSETGELWYWTAGTIEQTGQFERGIVKYRIV